MKRLIKWLLIIVVVGGGLWWFFLRGGGEANGSEILEPQIVSAERGDMRVVVEATGQVVANTSVEVKSKASGEILNLPYEEGDWVERGWLLVELDPDDERRNVERAQMSLRSAQARLNQSRAQLSLMESDAALTLTTSEANLRQARARFENAQAVYERRQGLFEEGVLSEEELQAAYTDFEVADVSYLNAQAAYEDAQNFPLNIDLRRQDLVLAEVTVRNASIEYEEALERMADTRIVAPATGVITDLQVEVGTIIASGISNVGGGTALMVISDLSRMFIEVQVDETDVGRVAVSQECEIIADAFPEQTLPGFVEWIAPQGTEESNITSFDVRVEIDRERLDPQILEEIGRRVAEDANPANSALSEWGLRPNMTARVEIIVADLED
ncbi:HlyD family secretion protein, partial [Candidatus Sumerlaeota bacterium]|nr:HlyD family secretion protein [Candidatus Sumerlaeota bacterium]